ncbi:GNAT family N-acetyltransferase [Lactiplantibacillus daoliensis]|uniref:GNAT family N-acetyltransferase n=1 Tax=Lactiplantibacillus daoliensis TaxID=2559916 RepID=A0ABW1UG97_9LACO|nr:GNAT family N-acetyltransferase [Lactiplantibacillus daoliensis]
MITYSNRKQLTAAQLAVLFTNSGIHRPTTDLPRLQRMLDQADCLWTAWDGQHLVGVARALTDFSYACYLSDLAVAQDYQHQGIGRELVRQLKVEIGPDVSLVLLAAPAAMTYYPKLEFEHIDNAFLQRRRPF